MEDFKTQELGEDLDSLRAKVEEKEAAEDSPKQRPVVMRMVLRRENEEKPPEDDRYIVIQNLNYFPAKNVYTHDELVVLFDSGIQITIRS